MPQCWLKALSYTFSFHWVLCAMVMSTDVSQVGVTVLPSFNIFIISPFQVFLLYQNYVLYLKNLWLNLVQILLQCKQDDCLHVL